MKRKKICWLTPDYFLDCDINIIPLLLNDFDIDWTVVLPKEGSRFNESDFEEYKLLKNLTINFRYSGFKDKNPRYSFFYFKLLNRIKKQAADINYLNHVATPFFTPVAMLLLGNRNTILTAHQGKVHSGFKFKYIFKAVYKVAYSWFHINHLFSDTQAKLFKDAYPDNKVHLIPLALKSFGSSNISKQKDKITFFNFGTIRPNKNIDILIDAACNIYHKGIRGFQVVLAGECDNWEFYRRKIRYPEIFKCDIRSIDNNEIADLFNKYHYLVLPYKIVTQSGPLKIAFNYNVPVIASDLKGFKDEIEDNKSGYLFKTANVEDLEMVLVNAINQHEKMYDTLRSLQSNYVKETYGEEKILAKYKVMFHSIS